MPSCRVSALASLTSTPHCHGTVLTARSDILRAVILRTRILLLYLLELRDDPNVRVGAQASDLYDDFQDHCAVLLLSGDSLSYSQIQQFMPHLLTLWKFEDLLTLNANTVTTRMLAET